MIALFGILRISDLFRREKWRNNLNNEFPDACGSWSVPNGCTRVTLDQAGCERVGSIPEKNSLIFNTNIDRLLNTQIQACVDDIQGSKLMSPEDLSSSAESDNLIHVTFNSGFFGFIDDMYIITEVYMMEGSDTA